MKPSPAGEAAGFSRTAVNGWKKGHLPTDSNLQKLSDFFNIPVSEFHECEDIKARDIKNGIKAKLEVIVESQKKTATNGDGVEISMEAQRLSGNREELKRLVDRLTDQEVAEYLADFRKTILGQ